MRRTTWTAIALGACALAPVIARADGPVPGEQIAQARVLGNEGIRLAEAGDCAAAIPKLEGAEQLYHAPTTLEQLGACLVKTGKVVAGAEALLRVARDPLPPNAPPVFAAAQERARQALAVAQGRIAQLTVHLQGAPASGATLTIDGAPFVAALLDTERPTDPGPHEIRATATGFEPAVATFTLGDGEHKRVDLALAPSAAAAPPPAAVPSPPADAASAALNGSNGGGPDRTPAYVAYGVGGVGLVVGAVFGALALSTKSSLDSACSPKTNCPSSSQSDIDALSTRAWVANGGFAVAILGAGLGTYFFLTAKDDPPAPSQAGVRVTPYLAGTTAGLTASF